MRGATFGCAFFSLGLSLIHIYQVLSTPLESLSINFTLGATVNVKAFVKSQVVDSQNIFVDSNLEWYNQPVSFVMDNKGGWLLIICSD